VIRDEKKAALI